MQIFVNFQGPLGHGLKAFTLWASGVWIIMVTWLGCLVNAWGLWGNYPPPHRPPLTLTAKQNAFIHHPRSHSSVFFFKYSIWGPEILTKLTKATQLELYTATDSLKYFLRIDMTFMSINKHRTQRHAFGRNPLINSFNKYRLTICGIPGNKIKTQEIEINSANTFVCENSYCSCYSQWWEGKAGLAG